MAERSQTKNVALVIILAITFLVVMALQFNDLPSGWGTSTMSGVSSPNDRASAASAGPNDIAPAAPPQVQIPWKRPDAVGPIARDPMRMDLQKTLLSAGAEGEPNNLPRLPDQPRFVVTGIIFSAEQPSAVIVDGRILHEGDTIHGATVVKITEEHAELSRGDKRWTIKPGQVNQEP